MIRRGTPSYRILDAFGRIEVAVRARFDRAIAIKRHATNWLLGVTEEAAGVLSANRRCALSSTLFRRVQVLLAHQMRGGISKKRGS
jgi:hypothetical protein